MIDNPDLCPGMAVVYLLLKDFHKANEFLAMIEEPEMKKPALNAMRASAESKEGKEDRTVRSAA
jgi:hypothetical protein